MSEEKRLLRRLAGLSFEPTECTSRFPALLAHLPHLPHSASSRSLLKNVGGTQVHIRIRKNRGLELGVAFVPRLSFRRGFKLLSRLGLRGLEGTWT